MTDGYTQFAAMLRSCGFARVERDDRLLDIYPKDTREKGIELWQRWDANWVDIVRMYFPYGNSKRVKAFHFKRGVIEVRLMKGVVIDSLLEDVWAEVELRDVIKG